VTPSEALQHVRTLVEASAGLKDDTPRKVMLRSVIVVQKGLGVAPDGVAECEPNVDVSHAVGGGPPPCSASVILTTKWVLLRSAYRCQMADIPGFRFGGFAGAPLPS
jgi:hypothetical protein